MIGTVLIALAGDPFHDVAELATSHGVAPLVRVLPPLPYGEILAAQRAADVLLLLLWDDPRDAGTFTGKLFEYIGARRPILAIGREDGVAVDLIRTRGLGIAARAVDDIAAALGRWIAEKRVTGRVPPPAREQADLSRQHQFAKIAGFLAEIARGKRGLADIDPSVSSAAPGRADAAELNRRPLPRVGQV